MATPGKDLSIFFAHKAMAPSVRLKGLSFDAQPHAILLDTKVSEAFCPISAR